MIDNKEIVEEKDFNEYMTHKTEIWKMEGNPDTPVESLYSKIDGSYIGSIDNNYVPILTEHGIAPQKSNKKHSVASIGFSESEQKWYGWSHRAYYGFEIGDILKEGDCATTSGWTKEYLAKHPEEDTSLPIGFEAKTLDDVKKMAIAFADSVS